MRFETVVQLYDRDDKADVSPMGSHTPENGEPILAVTLSASAYRYGVRFMGDPAAVVRTFTELLSVARAKAFELTGDAAFDDDRGESLDCAEAATSAA